MPKTPVKPEQKHIALAKLIKHESNTDVKITFGRTNGQVVLHVNGYTIKNDGEWATCPLNHEYQRETRARDESDKTSVEREQEVDGLQDAIRNREAI